jgi:hypothetical protein
MLDPYLGSGLFDLVTSQSIDKQNEHHLWDMSGFQIHIEVSKSIRVKQKYLTFLGERDDVRRRRHSINNLQTRLAGYIWILTTMADGT